MSESTSSYNTMFMSICMHGGSEKNTDGGFSEEHENKCFLPKQQKCVCSLNIEECNTSLSESTLINTVAATEAACNGTEAVVDTVVSKCVRFFTY